MTWPNPIPPWCKAEYEHMGSIPPDLPPWLMTPPRISPALDRPPDFMTVAERRELRQQELDELGCTPYPPPRPIHPVFSKMGVIPADPPVRAPRPNSHVTPNEFIRKYRELEANLEELKKCVGYQIPPSVKPTQKRGAPPGAVPPGTKIKTDQEVWDENCKVELEDWDKQFKEFMDAKV